MGEAVSFRGCACVITVIFFEGHDLAAIVILRRLKKSLKCSIPNLGHLKIKECSIHQKESRQKDYGLFIYPGYFWKNDHQNRESRYNGGNRNRRYTCKESDSRLNKLAAKIRLLIKSFGVYILESSHDPHFNFYIDRDGAR